MSSDESTSGSDFRLPRALLNLTLAAAFGIVAGLGIFTFLYAEGLSYFSDDPESCVNCHIMNDQFDAWSHSSHKAVAACNDCHTPHGTFVEKYLIKGINGWNHSLAFTTGDFPDPIQIKGFNAVIAQQNCIECHRVAVNQMHFAGSLDVEEMSCVACHGNVGHGKAGRAAHGPIYPGVERLRTENLQSEAENTTTVPDSSNQTTDGPIQEPDSSLESPELDD